MKSPWVVLSKIKSNQINALGTNVPIKPRIQVKPIRILSFKYNLESFWIEWVAEDVDAGADTVDDDDADDFLICFDLLLNVALVTLAADVNNSDIDAKKQQLQTKITVTGIIKYVISDEDDENQQTGGLNDAAGSNGKADGDNDFVTTINVTVDEIKMDTKV